ncbi:tetratricopeptide repeat protein [Halioxenophilus sp. WMMB6]|uniref:tetratricopeptide repeat protein n=1 Tax=Halioxenophilus sp. WMMB6 TaxID=3073815 RepID=UPI00295E587B|nr:tetratricopeptide repeat protein [Halioxenophilus sp. WMMB6]
MNDQQTRKIDLLKLYEEHRCLIIDDMPEMRGAIKRMVANQGLARIDTAPNAAEAIALCSTRHYSMILCDYNLGRSQDGQQLLETLRAKQLLFPTDLFIMITGETSREMVLGAIESQPDDYIAKPFTPSQFCRRLDRLLIKHQALLSIKKLFGEKQYREALALCDTMIANQERYAFDAERLRGRILFLLGQLHEAREHYERIIQQRPLPWAMLGLAQTLIDLGAEEQAEKILYKVLEQDHRYVEAHDLLSKLSRKRTDYEQAQQHTERACDLSPKSVRRQRLLADLAELNGDVETSLSSYKQAIRWGSGSIEESGSDYLNFARKTAESARLAGGKLSKEKGEQALRQVRRAREQYTDEPDMALQSALVSANVKQSFQLPGAEQEAEQARQLFQASQPQDAASHLDYVRLLQAAGNEQLAQEHLRLCAGQFADQREVMAKLERLSPKPLSADARTEVAKLTKSGIGAYQERNYSQATHIFKQALSLYPNHSGLNLNLVQVLLERHQTLLDENDVTVINRCFDRIRDIDASDPQFARAQALRQQFQEAQQVGSEATS